MKLFTMLVVMSITFTVNAIPLRIPSEQQAQADLEAFANAYICPNNQVSLMQAATQRMSCPAGQNLLPMVYKNLKNGVWDREAVLAMATGDYKLFQPHIENLVNIGNKKSNVVVIEYTDPQCPYCINFLQKQFAPIKKQYIDTGKIQYKFHHTPLSFHKDAFLASEANYCAQDQGEYLAYHQLLMRDMHKQNKNYLIDYAKKLNLDEKRFTACLDEHKYALQVGKEKAILEQVMPISFPFFIIGQYEDGKFIAHSIYGAPYFYTVNTNKLTQLIDKELKSSI